MESADIYLLPGLGFDERIFQKLDLHPHRVHYINWIEPVEDESLKEYAIRLARYYKVPANNAVLIGHSFGGIVAQEIAATMTIQHVIIISSIKSEIENPWHFRVLHRLGLIRFFTHTLIRLTLPIWAKSQKKGLSGTANLMLDMVKQHSQTYLQWALDKLSRWKAPLVQSGLTHIHGTKDPSFPFRLVQSPVKSIAGGTHFMVYTEAKQLSVLIRNVLEKLPVV